MYPNLFTPSSNNRAFSFNEDNNNNSSSFNNNNNNNPSSSSSYDRNNTFQPQSRPVPNPAQSNTSTLTRRSQPRTQTQAQTQTQTRTQAIRRFPVAPTYRLASTHQPATQRPSTEPTSTAHQAHQQTRLPTPYLHPIPNNASHTPGSTLNNHPRTPNRSAAHEIPPNNKASSNLASHELTCHIALHRLDEEHTRKVQTLGWLAEQREERVRKSEERVKELERDSEARVAELVSRVGELQEQLSEDREKQERRLMEPTTMKQLKVEQERANKAEQEVTCLRNQVEVLERRLRDSIARDSVAATAGAGARRGTVVLKPLVVPVKEMKEMSWRVGGGNGSTATTSGGTAT